MPGEVFLSIFLLGAAEEGDMSSCRGAIARCALVRRAEGARSRLLGPVSCVANVNNEIIVAFFPQPLQRKQHLKKNRFSFIRNMLCDEGTICLREVCLSELL